MSIPKVFISYIKEDWPQVKLIVNSLKNCGIEVWVDQDKLRPGARWADIIRKEIRDGDFFIACFSNEYSKRSTTYMNEELTLAIEELRKRKRETAWFIPLRLTECEIPDWSIGGGETLRSFHWVDLFKNWEEGLSNILETLSPSMPPFEHIYYKYHYKILNRFGSLTLINTSNHLRVLKKAISHGGTGWTCRPKDLRVHLTHLNHDGQPISEPFEVHYSVPKKKGLYYSWDEVYDPPLIKDQHVRFSYSFLVENEFIDSECIDSFLAYREIKSFEWLVDFPADRPAKRWWTTSDYEPLKGDGEIINENNTPTFNILWKYGPMIREQFIICTGSGNYILKNQKAANPYKASVCQGQ